MDKIVELFGLLILAVLGFVAPILGVLISLFREGMSKLASQYEAEELKTEDNIKKQLQKLAATPKINTIANEIKQTLKELQSIRKTARKKLSLLNPKKQMFNLFAPLVVAFIGVAFSFHPGIKSNAYLYAVDLSGSIFFFIFAINVMRNLFLVIAEVSKILDIEKKEREAKVIELLSGILESTEKVRQVYLYKVYIAINRQKIKDDLLVLKAHTEIKEKFKISIVNTEKTMAKNIEIGFIFPSLDFIIEKDNMYSVFIDEPGKVQVVRYTADSIQSNTELFISAPLTITPLKEGEYKIRVFVKGENIKTKYNYFKLGVASIPF